MKALRGWRRTAEAGLATEPVEATAICPSGTLVCALLTLMVPLSEIARACDIAAAELQRTVKRVRSRCSCTTCTRRRMRAEVLSEAQYLRLEAYLGAVVARGTEDASAGARAWEMGVEA